MWLDDLAVQRAFDPAAGVVGIGRVFFDPVAETEMGLPAWAMKAGRVLLLAIPAVEEALQELRPCRCRGLRRCEGTRAGR